MPPLWVATFVSSVALLVETVQMHGNGLAVVPIAE
jgi:hypothetical protein